RRRRLGTTALSELRVDCGLVRVSPKTFACHSPCAKGNGERHCTSRLPRKIHKRPFCFTNRRIEKDRPTSRSTPPRRRMYPRRTAHWYDCACPAPGGRFHTSMSIPRQLLGCSQPTTSGAVPGSGSEPRGCSPVACACAMNRYTSGAYGQVW